MFDLTISNLIQANQALFRHDWSTYHIAVIAAKRAQAIALHHYQRSLLNDGMWWNLTKNMSGLCKTHSRSSPDVDSLASYFDGKLSLSVDFDPNILFLQKCLM